MKHTSKHSDARLNHEAEQTETSNWREAVSGRYRKQGKEWNGNADLCLRQEGWEEVFQGQ